MKVLVCFQITHDFESLTFEEWEKFASGSDVLKYAKKVIDKVDEASIETALRLKDACADAAEEVVVDAITVADSLSEGFATVLYAAGASSVILVRTEECSGGAMAADYISTIARRGGYDIIFTGCQSSCWQGGITPVMISEKLGWRLYPYVQSLERNDEKILQAICRKGNDLATLRLETPAVCTMDDVYPVYLRIPTLRERLGVKDRKNIVEEPQKSFGGINDPERIRLDAVDRRRNCRMLDLKSPEDLQLLKELIMKEIPDE